MPEIDFAPIGIGNLLRRSRHIVPANQRSYAWEERNVTDLLQDIHAEMTRPSTVGAPEYFLGTIVLVDSKDGKPPQISDGQQRLATTSIILARIRDVIAELGDTARASALEGEYLYKTDFDSGEGRSQIGLNIEDNEFYNGIILKKYPHDIPENTFLRASNRRLLSASKTAYEYVRGRVDGFHDDLKISHLRDWVAFIKEKTTVVAVTVPDQNQAFRIFETLNDRGVRASQVDLLKNFFLETSGERMAETHALWNELTGKIEANFPDEDDQMILYLRHLWITRHGHTIEKQLSSKIRSNITSGTLAANFVSEANSSSTDYIALSEPNHPKWAPPAYKFATGEYINTINRYLKVEQIRPLLFAIAMRFPPDETTKAFRFCVNMSVRFLIYGGRGGFLDEHYAARAHDIGTGKITRARELRDAMLGDVPTDPQFESAFATARVSKGYLARYYLRAIDKTLRGEEFPEYIANPDYDAANLEHIIPLKAGEGWGLSRDELSNVQNLIGNLTLLSAKDNGRIGNDGFAEKLQVYKHSNYSITNQLENYGNTFTLKEIEARQSELAKLAVKTWPLTFSD